MPAEITGPVTDTGTGAYPNPPTGVTVESPVEQESTGAFPPPPAEVTVTSLDHEEGPTGAAPNPPAEVSSYAWPAEPPSEAPAEPSTKAVTASEPGVENKAVTASEPAVEDKGPDLEGMTKAELQEAYPDAGLTTRMTKDEMITAIRAAG